MQLTKGGEEIAPGISVVPYPGHTRNMQAVILRSGGQTACYISDLLPTTWHLDVTWVMAYDLFPLEVIENRKRYYQTALAEDCSPCLLTIRKFRGPDLSVPAIK